MASLILLNDETYERVDGTSGDDQPYSAPDGFSWHETEGDIATRTLVMRNGELVEIDWTPPSPEQALAKAQADRWARAKEYRDMRQAGGVATQWGPVQTDAVSQGRIGSASLGASLRKTMGQPFAIDWTMADNSIVTLDADGMVALGFAVFAYVAACQDAGTAVRDQIGAALTPEAVAAIDITAGYPAA